MAARAVWAACSAASFLLGCSTAAKVGTFADQVVLAGAITGAHARASAESEYRIDVKACGSQPGSEWCRLAADDRNSARAYPPGMVGKPAVQGGQIVFDQSECAVPLAHGRCPGLVVMRSTAPPSCHGQIIDGQCSGPVF